MPLCSFLEKSRLIRTRRTQLRSRSKMSYLSQFITRDINVCLFAPSAHSIMATASFLVCALLQLATPSLARGLALDPTIKHVSVVFRHGDRAPDLVELYPNDPYFGNDFFPVGIGGLTNAGKIREFNLGKALRNRYDKFLGNTYLPEDVYARSTDYLRTKMCLQLVLAALYPPKGEQIWNENLMWQPIPNLYENSKNDWLMIPEECPEYLREYEKVERLPQVLKKIKEFEEFMQNLSEWTGKKISTPTDMFNLYHALTAEAAMNLTLPEWTKDIFPHGKLLDGINLWYEMFSYNIVLRKLNGGKLMQSIVEDMNAVKEGKFKKSKKISLYSGHETNIVALSQAYGFYQPHVPEYTSAVITELYEMNSEYYVKVVYYRGIPPRMTVVHVQGCQALCPFNKFMKVIKNILPSNNELVCDKSEAKEANGLLTNTV